MLSLVNQLFSVSNSLNPIESPSFTLATLVNSLRDTHFLLFVRSLGN
jgi:hypothetical protein